MANRGVDMSEWVSVEDRLLEVKPFDGYMSSEPVLAYFDPATNEHPLEIMIYQPDDYGIEWLIASTLDTCMSPLYWMPLPAPPVNV